MEVVEVFHMKGGMGENSYAQNSLLQQKVSMTKPIIEEAMKNLYYSSFSKSTTIAIADFGCSSGPNTLFVVFELIKSIEKIRRNLGHPSPEYHVFLNDLPSNDFNSIFMSLSNFQEMLKEESIGPCFFSELPVLSTVPRGLKGNNGNIYISRTSSPNVLKAYYVQFQKDFTMFLKCRSEELMPGGRMVLTIQGRRGKDPWSKESCYIWELLALALNKLVIEEVIDEETFNTFNIPFYTPSPFEVKSEIENEESFYIDHLEIHEQHWNAHHGEPNLSKDFKDGGHNVAKCIRAVIEPFISSHFRLDKAIMDEVFDSYKAILNNCMSKEKTEYVNLTVSMALKE